MKSEATGEKSNLELTRRFGFDLFLQQFAGVLARQVEVHNDLLALRCDLRVLKNRFLVAPALFDFAYRQRKVVGASEFCGAIRGIGLRLNFGVEVVLVKLDRETKRH